VASTRTSTAATKAAKAAKTAKTAEKVEQWGKITRDDDQDTGLRKTCDDAEHGNFYKSSVENGSGVRILEEKESASGTEYYKISQGRKTGWIKKMYVTADEADDSKYIAEEILDQRELVKGKHEYLVQWEGWPGQDTWEPFENVEGTKALAAWEDSQQSSESESDGADDDSDDDGEYLA
jgi:hypothetical protein